MFSHMLLMVIKSSVVRKRPRMMRGCCEYSRRLHVREEKGGRRGPEEVQWSPDAPELKNAPKRLVFNAFRKRLGRGVGHSVLSIPSITRKERNRGRRGPEEIREDQNSLLRVREGPERSRSPYYTYKQTLGGRNGQAQVR